MGTHAGWSVDKKRMHRTRLKRACKPLLERFNCTQAELAGCVESLISRADAADRKVEQLKEELSNKEDRIKALKEELEMVKAGYSQSG